MVRVIYNPRNPRKAVLHKEDPITVIGQTMLTVLLFSGMIFVILLITLVYIQNATYRVRFITLVAAMLLFIVCIVPVIGSRHTGKSGYYPGR